MNIIVIVCAIISYLALELVFLSLLIPSELFGLYTSLEPRSPAPPNWTTRKTALGSLSSLSSLRNTRLRLV